MNKLYMGIDSGSIYTKGVIIDKYNNIIVSDYVETLGDPIGAFKKVICNMKTKINFELSEVVAIGVTGVARKLIGTFSNANIVKNEITASVVGARTINKDIKTIMAIGGVENKIIFIDNDQIKQTVFKNTCLLDNGSFMNLLAKKMNIRIEDISDIAKRSKNKIEINDKCSLTLEEEIFKKIKEGYKQEDILATVSEMIAFNYYNNVIKTGKILSPIMAIGGVTKNKLVVKELEKLIGKRIITDKNAHLIEAIGVGVLARESGKEKIFDFNIDDDSIEAKMINCTKCSNNCFLTVVYKNKELINCWGYKCQNGNKLKICK